MVYYYPEASAFWLAPFALACAAAAYRAYAPRQIFRQCLLGALLLLFFIPIIKSNFYFLLTQAQQATSSVNWWYQFFAFFRGRDGFLELHNGVSASHVFADGVDFLASLSGGYFVTPGPQANSFLAAILRLGLMLVLAFAALRTWAVFKTVPRARQGALILIPVFTLLTLEAAYLLARKQIWSAGKGLTFFIPIVLAACFSGLALSDSGRSAFFSRLGKGALWTLLFIQIGTGVNRMRCASRENGIHYASPYPSVQEPALKTDFNYADTSFLEGLQRGDQVTLDLDDPFILRFVRLTLYSRGISATSERPILAYWNDDVSLGKITPAAPPNVRLRLTKASPANPFRRLEMIKLTR
jgi:hypothetical protein